MIVGIVGFVYLGIGACFAIWMRSSYTTEREWVAGVPAMILGWLFIGLAIFGAKIYYDVRHWWRWRRG